jgi:hypothetical protein
LNRGFFVTALGLFTTEEWAPLSVRSSWKGLALVAHCWLVLVWLILLGRAQVPAQFVTPAWESAWPWIMGAGQVLAWFAVIYGVARGAVVLYDSRRFFASVEGSTKG